MDAHRKLQILSGYVPMEQEGEPTPGTVPSAADSPGEQTERLWVPFQAKMGGGRTVPLLKTMLSSCCENDCNYCVFRRQRDFQRVSFSPEEMAATFMQLVQRGIVKGLFLSSGLTGSGVKTQDRLIKTVEIIRLKYRFGGYIHLKIMPGAEEAQIERAMQLSTRVSLNLEAPDPCHLQFLAAHKDFSGDLFPRVMWMSRYRRLQAEQRPWLRATSLITQMVVGAAGETDVELLATSEMLYRRYDLARVYYSRFNPAPDTPLEGLPPAKPIRIARLYQASFLLRDYGFSMEELPFSGQGSLPEDTDPKLAWARMNLSEKPVEINHADREQLLRIPGVGVTGAQRILDVRRQQAIDELSQLSALRISARRAAPFILLNGKRPAVQMELFSCG